jgi:hypothetical protein
VALPSRERPSKNGSAVNCTRHLSAVNCTRRTIIRAHANPNIFDVIGDAAAICSKVFESSRSGSNETARSHVD